MKKIVFYGDSNTFGYDPQGFMGGRYPENIRWVDILNLEMKAYEVIGRGMNGRMIPTSKFEIEGLDRMIEGLSPMDCFAIMLGTNDILLTDNPDWEIAARNMRNLIKHIKGLNVIRDNNTKIMLVSPPLMFPSVLSNNPFYMYGVNSVLLADEYRKIAVEEGVLSISADKWNVDLAFDGVHISEKGSMEFAEHMKRELCALLLD